MENLKTKIVVLAVTLLLGIAGPAASYGEQPRLTQVVYITLTKACGCTLVICQAGDIVVGNVFNGARQSLLKRIDYSTDKEAARVYLKKYRVTQAPALLFLDAQGNLLWMRAGELSEPGIAAQLGKFGM
ncbi:MAG: hypothetical protein KKD99_00320 [Proteobacteria bacterium]|nr:hypothetical protein [Pseudomonadota bacterium]MBU4356146.1 hypothetical protein [Pseudomonadota bacterium]MBU4446997.1 hypothetical protein [Pseudomonadota bacterium]MCG2773972.1 hypothetical protein [Desulfobacterales bacterium]